MNYQEIPKAFFKLSEKDKEKLILFEMDIKGNDYRYATEYREYTKPLKDNEGEANK